MAGSPEEDGGKRVVETARERLERVAGSTLGRLRASRAFTTAATLSAIWLGGVVAYGVGFFGLFESAVLAPHAASAIEVALFLLAALAPITLFVYGALLAEKADEIRHAASRLAAVAGSLDLTAPPRPAAQMEDLGGAVSAAVNSALAEEKGALAAAVEKLDAALAETQAMVERIEGRESAARRAGKTTGAAETTDRAQPALPFGAEAEIASEPPAAIPWESVVRAIDFPKDAHDRKGFEALRQVVADRSFAELLQASEDTLSLLAEDGLYMEDLTPEPAAFDVWKRYAAGERGAEVAAVGGVREEAALDVARTRLRKDPVFRDTALHFLRRYDRLLSRMVEELGEDPMITEAADSRTGRAFMIVARVTGAFD